MAPTTRQTKVDEMKSSEPEVAFLLEGVPVVKFRPEDFGRKRPRVCWNSSTDFMFVVLAFIIGLGNFQFPYLCYIHGGVVFLIPYFAMIFLVAMPILVLETVLGHLMQSGCLTVWNLIPFFKGLGVASFVVLIWRNAYYATVVVWAMIYAYQSFQRKLPWNNCAKSWNSINCRMHNQTFVCLLQNQIMQSTEKNGLQFLRNFTFTATISDGLDAQDDQLYDEEYVRKLTVCEDVRYPSQEFWELKILNATKSIEDFGEFRVESSIAVAVAWIFCLICVIAGIKVLGKLVYVAVLIPYCILFAMMLRSFGLPGIFNGVFEFYLNPNICKLLSFKVWIDALENVLYTFGPGLGVFFAIGSYNPPNKNTIKQICFLCILGGLTSLLVGYVVLAYVSHAAYESLPLSVVKSLIKDDLSLLFTAFPAAIVLIRQSSNIWSFLFYFTIAYLGIITQAVSVEALLTALIDRFSCLQGICIKRFFLSIFACGILGGAGLLFVAQNGIFLYHIFRTYSATSFPLIIICIFECLAIAYFFGACELFKKVKFFLNYKPFCWWSVCWVVLTPATLIAGLVLEILQYEPLKFLGHRFPWWNDYILIWTLMASSVIWIFILAFLSYICAGRCRKEMFRADFKIREQYPKGNLSTSVTMKTTVK